MNRKPNINTKIIEDFKKQYYREYDFYNATSLLAAQLIETQLINKGIRAIVTSRAKKPSRLFDKIVQRANNEGKHYENQEDIYNDIVDLAGVRIALYFNTELDEIEQIIDSIFIVHMKKEFPVKGKSQGYKAIHYRGNIRANSLTGQQQRYSKTNVEIQVASLLMHAWAEVEHDIVYKPLHGRVSVAEQKALDELNAIVLQGEGVLAKLQQAMYKRNSFNDHYDLYNFLIQYFSEKDDIEAEQVPIGDIKKLYNFLYDNGIDTQKKLKNRIKDFNIMIGDNWTLSDQIMDYISGNYKVKYQSYFDNNTYNWGEDISTKASVGAFLLTWIKLEKILKSNDGATPHKDTIIRLKSLVNTGVLSNDDYEEIYKIRSVRNNLVHGIEMPDSKYLAMYTKETDSLIQKLINNKNN